MLPGFFESIARQQYRNYILYIVDNSPSEKTNAVLADCVAKHPVTEWQHLVSAGNIGVAAGNNAGIRKALADGCDQLLILNNDIEIPAADAFERLLQVQVEKKADMLVPKIYYYPGGKIWMAGGYMNKWRALGIHEGFKKDDGPQFDKGHFISYAPTCYMLVDRKVFEQAGIMDEKYFAYYDDTDFVLRATEQGFTLWYEPSVSILHKVSFSSGGEDSLFYIFYSNRNKLYFARKNLKGLQKLVAIGLTFFTRFFYLLRFNKAQRKELIRGLREGMRYPVDRTATERA